MAIGVGSIILSLLCVIAFGSYFIASILFFIGGWRFMMDWKNSKK
jgi:hypothetical protein